MGIQVNAVGYGYPPPELPQDRAAFLKTHAPVASTTALPEHKPAVDLERTTADLEKISLAFNKKLRFVVDQDLEEVIVKVIDPATDKVIKELPPEELQRLHLRIKEMIGLLFDEQV